MPQERPWYREPLVWMLIAFPLTAVVAGIATYIIADRTRDGLVVDDYYKQGKEINLSLARDHAAQQLGLKGEVVLAPGSQQVQLSLEAKPGSVLPSVVSLRWLHGTRSGFDRTQQLRRQPDGRYRADLPELAPGHWYVQLEAQDWRLQGSLRVPAEMRVALTPGNVSPDH